MCSAVTSKWPQLAIDIPLKMIGHPVSTTVLLLCCGAMRLLFAMSHTVLTCLPIE